MARRTANVRSDSRAKAKPTERKDSGFITKPVAQTDSDMPESSKIQKPEPHPADVTCSQSGKPAAVQLLARDAGTMSGNVALLDAAIATLSSPIGSHGVRSNVVGTLLVRDLGYQKVVGIRYSDDDGATWANAYAQWSCDAGDGVQKWSFEIAHDTPLGNRPGLRFACFYQDVATDNWHWDNNSGDDYHLSAAS
jgi:hypothetical protein